MKVLRIVLFLLGLCFVASGLHSCYNYYHEGRHREVKDPDAEVEPYVAAHRFFVMSAVGLVMLASSAYLTSLAIRKRSSTNG